MEDNNRGTEQKINIEAVLKENNELKEAYNKLVTRVQDLNNTWMLNRAGMLMEITKNESFPSEIKEKAIKELSEFLYPTRNETEEQTDKE